MKISKEKKIASAVELRRRAEEQLKANESDSGYCRSDDETKRLLHELQVHQIELEMQNAELCQARDEVETALEKYTDLYNFAPVGYFTLDQGGTIRAVNIAGAGFLGGECAGLTGRRFVQFVTEEYRTSFTAFLGTLFKSRVKEICQVALLKYGNTPLVVHIEAMITELGEECRIALIDISGRRLSEERISEVIQQQQAILDNIPNTAWLKDRQGKYVAVNDPFGRLFGMAPRHLVGMNDYDLYPHDLAVKYEQDTQEVIENGTRRYFEESAIDQDGNTQHLEKIETPIFNDTGAVIGIIGIANDITNRKEVELTLRYDSTHDSLTGLYNRAFFDEDLERLGRGRLFPSSIVMADINGLKTVNDTLGHEAGDRLIQLAAAIILREFRAEDTVARIGGDEFAVLLRGASASVAEEAVERIMKSPEITNGEIAIAFGIASAENRKQLNEALKLGDNRMYLNKSAQKY